MDFSRPGRPPISRERTPPAPISSQPLFYTSNPPLRAAPSSPPTQIPKRRSLTSSTANSAARSQGTVLTSIQNTSEAPLRSAPIRKSSFEFGDDAFMRKPAQESENWEPLQHYHVEGDHSRESSGPPPIMQSLPFRQMQSTDGPQHLQEPQAATISFINSSEPNSRHTSGASLGTAPEAEPVPPPLQYHHRLFEADNRRRSVDNNNLQSGNELRRSSDGPQLLSSKPSSQHLAPNASLGANLSRPSSAYSSSSELGVTGRARSPGQYGRTPSPSRLSPDSRPMSYVDLLNVPYPQPPPAPSSLDNSHLRSAVGQNASLLSTKKTLEMYRANVKKTNDPTIQYEFAIFMINTAQEMAASGLDDEIERQPSPRSNRDGDGHDSTTSTSSVELLREARHILQKLSDRSYPFAQYYLADGYASGLFNKGIEDNDRAFPLFVAASKHGHAEAGYRAALCYEFGWGCRKDLTKAVQFYRQAASKNHPGAMARLGRACLTGDMGLGNRYREGVKWLKRAAESADFQYNSAPYELGILHETGYGDDIFQDEAYAAQLFTQSADLGHAEANYRLGDAYEHGKLSCPKDPALSVHFYTRAAEKEHPLAMMALCAWYMVGAEPVLEKDENEAYEWAKKAAETGLPKAEYAVGYFTEMGIGCRRDPLESNRWYVKAAESGDERAKHRLAAITAAASGASSTSSASKPNTSSGKPGEAGKKRWGLF